jgi:hypothetical protein
VPNPNYTAENKEIIHTEVSERDQVIKSLIVWQTDYSTEIENTIIDNLNMLPDSILDSWLSLNSNIIVCPNVKGYLDKFHLYLEEKGTYTTGYTKVSNDGEIVSGADIYILGSVDNIEDSIIHEIGHYVYYAYFGIRTGYVLPNYETESYKFATEERDGSTYYMEFEKEYFAEMFEYVIINGVSDEYKDTHVMQEIIEDFRKKS